MRSQSVAPLSLLFPLPPPESIPDALPHRRMSRRFWLFLASVLVCYAALFVWLHRTAKQRNAESARLAVICSAKHGQWVAHDWRCYKSLDTLALSSSPTE